MGMIKLPERSLKFFSENYNQIFDSGELAEGKWNKQIADWISIYTKAPYGLAVNSNGAGLYTILRLLKEYRKKKKIILQSNTMYGVRTIGISSGLELCSYVDCSLDYLMPTYNQIKKVFDGIGTPSEYVFLITHIGGWVNPDIERIAILCKERDITLIEDCAHSLGSLLNGVHTGLFGDAGVYSLYATKAIPVGEGGILVTKDSELHEMASKFVIYDRFEQKLDVGINLRMSEINALLSYAVLQETEAIIENKYAIAKQYIDACTQFKIEFIDPIKNGQRSNLYKFLLLSRSATPEDDFKKIKTRTSPVYDYVLGNDSDEICKRHICLPIWFNQNSDVTERVLKELASV